MIAIEDRWAGPISADGMLPASMNEMMNQMWSLCKDRGTVRRRRSFVVSPDLNFLVVVWFLNELALSGPNGVITPQTHEVLKLQSEILREGHPVAFEVF